MTSRAVGSCQPVASKAPKHRKPRGTVHSLGMLMQPLSPEPAQHGHTGAPMAVCPHWCNPPVYAENAAEPSLQRYENASLPV